MVTPVTQVWTVSLPVTILNSPNVTKFRQPAFGTGRDIAGVILFAIGFFMESVSDIQKYRFRSKPENKGKVCDVGLFVWTRHPNYFGEIVIQFGKSTLSSKDPRAYHLQQYSWLQYHQRHTIMFMAEHSQLSMLVSLAPSS